ncbi:MAG: hypothetical protein U5J95_10420 [Balneolaceae bacterium]|nr:hypothetical protein [Balneolaceae bacterium]
MPNGGFDDHIWDEHRWEAHLDEIEKKSQQLRNFIAPDPSGNIPRWITLLRENSDEHEAVDAFIEEELQIEEAYFPDEDDEEWDEDEFEDDLDDFFYDELDEEDFLFDEEIDDFDEGEEWKELSDEYAMSDYGSIESLDIYNEAREMAAYILQWSEGIHPKYLSPQYNEFVANILKIGAKLAGGYSFGFEIDFLGGNIAYTKKALYCANNALTLLQENLKEAPIMTADHYAEIHGRLFELRNDIGIYVQELREKFYKGFE